MARWKQKQGIEVKTSPSLCVRQNRGIRKKRGNSRAISSLVFFFRFLFVGVRFMSGRLREGTTSSSLRKQGKVHWCKSGLK